MLLTLFRVQGTRYWHDICANEYLAEGDEWVPDSGEDPVDFYVWGLSERWVRWLSSCRVLSEGVTDIGFMASSSGRPQLSRPPCNGWAFIRRLAPLVAFTSPARR